MVVKGRDVWFAIMPNIVEWFKGGWMIMPIFYTFLTSWEKRVVVFFKSKFKLKPKFI